MIGGLFIYNHKGEVLISRVYRDDIGYVLLQHAERLLDPWETLVRIFCVGGVSGVYPRSEDYVPEPV